MGEALRFDIVGAGKHAFDAGAFFGRNLLEQFLGEEQRAAGSKTAANALQVRVELQADCLSGLWVNREEKKRPGFIEAGDIDGALATASAIGDDTLQRETTGRVVPDSFTHGSAEQRKRWFMTGFTQGKVSACNTFNALQL